LKTYCSYFTYLVIKKVLEQDSSPRHTTLILNLFGDVDDDDVNLVENYNMAVGYKIYPHTEPARTA
jgi:hypothetical protein